MITLEAKILRESLEKVIGIVSQKPIIDIHRYLLVQLNESHDETDDTVKYPGLLNIYTIANNMLSMVSLSTVSNVGIQNLKMLFPALKLYGIISTLDPKSELRIEFKEDLLEISSGKSIFSIRSMATSIPFPWCDQESKLMSFQIPNRLLKYLLKIGEISMGWEHIRTAFNGVCFNLYSDGILEVLSTDIHRLTYCRTELESEWLLHGFPENGETHTEIENSGTEIENSGEETQSEDVKPILQVIIPNYCVTEVMRNISAGNARVTVTVGEEDVSFKYGGYLLITSKLNSEFPPFFNLLNKQYNFIYHCNRKELASKLRQILAVGITDKVPLGVFFEFDGSEVRMFTSNQDGDKVVIYGKVSEPADKTTICFDGEYLRDIVLSLQSEEVEFHIRDRLSPVCVTEKEGKHRFQHILMPKTPRQV